MIDAMPSVLANEMPYDLRVARAEIIGTLLNAILQAKFNNDFQMRLKLLSYLNTAIKHKVKPKRKDASGNEVSFDSLYKAAVGVTNTYTEAYRGNDKTAEAVGKIEDALVAVEEYLWQVMEDAKLFGGGRDIRGLI